MKETIETKMQETIKKYQLIENKDKIVVGVSGGPDSMCLLDNLKEIYMQKSQSVPFKLSSPMGTFPKMSPKKPETNGDVRKIEIVVAHVNHMIRKEADDDEEYVKKYCKKNGIEFYSKSIDVKKLAHTNKIGEEEAGRMARYEFFEEVLNKTNATKIAVAHNKNDKIETILFHTLRGSGVEGLKGIEAKNGKIIRPLIMCERKEIENYCKENKLNPRMDKTNLENIYTRNKIRNVVIPYLQKEFNPNIIKTLDRLSSIVTGENEYMENQTKMAYDKMLIKEVPKQEIRIDLKTFNLQETVIKARLIRYIIKRLLGSTNHIEKIHIDDIIKLCHNNIGNKYLTPNKNIKILLKNHQVYFMVLS